MQTLIKLTFTSLLLFFCTLAQAELEGTENYGVYVQSAEGFVQAPGSSSIRRINRDFTTAMFDFPVIVRDTERLELIVHHPDFHPDFLELHARPMSMAGSRSGALDTDVRPEGDDRYRIMVRQPIPDDHIVLIMAHCCFGGVHGVALDSPRDVIFAAYGEGKGVSPGAAENTLGLVADALPDDEEVADLHAYWQMREQQRDATRFFEFVESLWAQYESAEGAEARIQALQRVKNHTEHYLEEYPQGLERDEIAEMDKKATQGLDI